MTCETTELLNSRESVLQILSDLGVDDSCLSYIPSGESNARISIKPVLNSFQQKTLELRMGMQGLDQYVSSY